MRLNQHDAPVGARSEGRLPFLLMRSLAALTRNGSVSIERDNSDVLVALGPRIRRLAKRWGSDLPPE